MKTLTSTYLLIFSCLALSLQTLSQTLTIDTTYSLQQLVEGVLIGPSIQLSNIQYTGHVRSLGYFNGSNSNIGLNDGVILSTGKVINAEGPNQTPLGDAGTEFHYHGDSVLASISGSPLGTYDAAILEFDFQLPSDSVYLRYVFASNEYMLYAGTGVNDVFAFLISGPGIVGEENLALIPGTLTPVSIDNVNANVNQQYYIDNENPPGATVEYNGFTQVFTANGRITPNQTYHIRIALADAGDGAFDSAIFLERGSFTSSLIGLGLENVSSNINAMVYPNPASKQITIAYDNPHFSDFQFSINDALGKLVKSEVINQPTIHLATDNLPNGLYYFNLSHSTSAKTVQGRFIIQHD